MDVKNQFDKGTLLIILLVFLFSHKLIDIVWDIGKSLIYLIIIIFGINYLNPQIANKIKQAINDFINIGTDKKFISDSLFKITNNSTANLITKSQEDMVTQPNDLRLLENRNLSNTNKTNNRQLTE